MNPPAIRVRMRLFAMQREQAGTREVEVELPAGATIEDAWTALVQRHPVLGPGRAAVRFARNAEYASPEDLLADGDELACIPPVSGGELEATTDPRPRPAGVAGPRGALGGSLPVHATVAQTGTTGVARTGGTAVAQTGTTVDGGDPEVTADGS